MYNFNGKVALITGGTDGIGLATARAFVTAGAKVLVAGRNPERGQRALDELVAASGIGNNMRFLPVDVSEPAQVEKMVATCVDAFGRLDFAVNNAAAEFPLVLTADIPLESVDQSIAVDLRGTWLCMKHEIDVMLKAGGGAIVNVSSVNGFASSPNAAMYSATKHGMNGLTTAAAREYISKGIRINSVCPGAIETPRRQRRLTGFTAEQITAHYAALAEQVPAGRVGRADEVAAGILWLCSDESSYVVGHHLVIDGGLSA
ncbi:MAG: SDR family oxidoreductase [Betaproteobacteria bacterium]|nr:SDR family oxidoreductase [Betaproteobacteria bacterium]